MLRALVFGAVALGAACSKESAPQPGSAPHQGAPTEAATTKDPATARTLIAAGAKLIDVRTPEEFEAGHLPGATNIPIGELDQRGGDLDALVNADKSAPVVVYCGTGRRAGKAQEILRAAGFTQVINGGGLKDLQ